MKKIVAGLVVLLLLAAAGYFAFGRFATSQVEKDVAAAFAELRARGTGATYRSLGVDAANRGVTLAGLAIALADGTRITAERLTATGATPVHDGRFTADTLDIEGLAVRAPGAGPGSRVEVDLPKLMIDRYVGPVALARDPEPSSPAPADPYGPLRAVLLQLAATSAAKATIPAISFRATHAPDSAQPAANVTITDVAAEGVEYGKIRSLLIDRIAFATDAAAAAAAAGDAGDAGAVKGEVDGLVAARIDTAPLLAMTGATASGDQYQEVYGKVVTAAYRLTRGDGVSGSTGPMVLEHMGIKPAAFAPAQVARLDRLALKGGDLSLDEARELLEATSALLDGIAFGSLSITNGVSRDGEETLTFASAALEGYAASQLDGLTLSGVSGTSADTRSMKLDRLAVRQLSLRQLAGLADLAEAPSPWGALGLFRLLSAVELDGLELPYDTESPGAGTPVKIGHFALSWGQFAGSIPTRVALTLKDATGPIHASDGEPYVYLANAGMTSATLNLDFRMAYDEEAKALTLAPVGMQVDDAFAITFEGGLGGLPPAMFDGEAAAAGALIRATARPFRLTLTDLGLARLMLEQLSAASGTTPDATRQDALRTIDDLAATASAYTPDAAAVAEAAKAFVMNPTSITLAGTPVSQDPVAPLLMADDLLAVLKLFKLTASVAPGKDKPAP